MAKPKSDSRVAMLAEAAEMPIPASTAAVQPPQPQKDRLPAGSRKVLSWNGVDWSGVLTVPGCPEFRHTDRSERGCCWGLDDRYREWVKQQEQTP